MYWRSALRRSWRQAVVLSLVGGLLAGIALGALAGARRTASAYDRYLRATNASDVLVDIPGELPGFTFQRSIGLVSALPGVYPSVLVIDFKPGATAQQRTALVHRIVSANPDGTPGGSYELPPMQASAVHNAAELGGQPVALAAGLAAASVLSLSMTVLSLVRRRRREFALLKALGMTRRQVRAVIAWQTSLTLLIAVVAGVPLGTALGRLAWQHFAGSLGVVPVSVVPFPLVGAGAAVLLVTGNLLASLPGTLAARTQAALVLKAE
jgi:hypothetical protein